MSFIESQIKQRLQYDQEDLSDAFADISRSVMSDDTPFEYKSRGRIEENALGELLRYFGDLDGDGIVTSADALAALRISVGLEKMGDNTLTFGDIDGDSAITSADALEILRYSVGASTNEKIGKPIAA